MQNHRSPNAHGARSHRLLAVTAATLAALAVVLLRPAASDAAAKGPVVSTATTSLGRILIGPRGRTLYLFAKDRTDKSACAGMCATSWPPLIASGTPVAGAGAKASLLGTTKRADGRLQVTYNHHPLYTFVQDTKKGQTNGQELNAFGAEWYAISPAGANIEKQASVAPPATTTNGGYPP
jgi:predicted lipoprotein with Yx(FWY)xxD motif